MIYIIQAFHTLLLSIEVALFICVTGHEVCRKCKVACMMLVMVFVLFYHLSYFHVFIIFLTAGPASNDEQHRNIGHYSASTRCGVSTYTEHTTDEDEVDD